VSATGNWTIQVGGLAVGAHTITAVQTSRITHVSSGPSRAATVKVWNPTPVPTVSAPANVPLTFTLTGTGAAGDTVYLYDGSSLIARFRITATDGSWTLTLTLSPGTHALSATEVDPVSTLVSDPSSTLTINAIAVPAAPTLSVSAISTSPVTVSGTCVAGDTVTLYDGSTVVASVGCVGGTWSWTGPLALGRHTLSATQSEPVLGLTSSASRSATVTVFNPTPAPTISAPANAPTTFTVGGTGVTGDTVYLYDGSALLAQFKITASNGTWSRTLTLAAGTHALSATEVDPVSTLVSDSSATVAVNAIATPSSPTLSAPAVSAPSVAVSGSCTAGDTVTLADGSTVLASLACGDGTWAWAGTLGLGKHTLSATQSEPVLGLTSAARSTTVTVYALPGAPTLVAPASSGSRVALSGSCTSGDSVRVYDGSALVATVACTRNGSWSTTLTLAGGAHTFTASQVDGTSGLEGARSGAATTTVVAPPSAPTMSVPTFSGTSVPVTGTGIAGDTITVSYGRSSVTTTVAADGTWSVSLSLGWGVYTLSATQSDSLGQTSDAVSAWVYVTR
jgi:hypothetical protein